MIGFRCECGAAIDCTYPKCKEGVEVSSKDITERLRDYARDYTTTTYHDDLICEAVTEIESLRQQATLLLGVIKKFLSDNDPEGFGCACSPNHICGPCSEAKRQRPLYEALAELEKQNEELMIELCRRSTK